MDIFFCFWFPLPFLRYSIVIKRPLHILTVKTDNSMFCSFVCLFVSTLNLICKSQEEKQDLLSSLCYFFALSSPLLSLIFGEYFYRLCFCDFSFSLSEKVYLQQILSVFVSGSLDFSFFPKSFSWVKDHGFPSFCV